MKHQQPTQTEDRSLTAKRREVLGVLAAAGTLGAVGTAAGDVQVGGGPMSDELAHLNVRWYEGPEGEVPDPGVEGRYFQVTEGGSLWETGDVLEDRGDQWRKIDIGVGQATAESVHTESTRSGTVEIDHSETWPHGPRQPERATSLKLAPHPGWDNPALEPGDLTHPTENTVFVADPFWLPDFETGDTYVYYEVKTDGSTDANQDLAWGSVVEGANGLKFEHGGYLLTPDSFNLSHPLPIRDGGVPYMVPSHNDNANLKVYEITSVPDTVSLAGTVSLPNSSQITDPTPFKNPKDGRWYLINTDGSSIRLYYFDSISALLSGDVSEHPSSPITSTSTTRAVASGRPEVTEDGVYTYYQNRESEEISNRKVDAWKITELTTSSYSEERVNTVVRGTNGRGNVWNGSGMHHVDRLVPSNGRPDMAVVDGKKTSSGNWRLGVYTSSPDATGLTKARESTATTIPDVSFTTIEWDVTDPDELNAMDTANNAFVAPKTGWYDIDFTLGLDCSGNTTPIEVWVRIYVDGSIEYSPRQSITSAAERHLRMPMDPIYMERGQELTTDVRLDIGESGSDSGESVSTLSSSSDSSRLVLQKRPDR